MLDDTDDYSLERVFLKYDDSYKYTVQHCIDME